MSPRVVLATISTLILLGGPALSAPAQDVPLPKAGVSVQEGAGAVSPDAVATNGPAGVQESLRTPRSAIREFLAAVAEAEERAERIDDAIRCMDLSGLEDEHRETLAAQRADQLEHAIDLIIRLHGRTTEDVPEEVEGEEYVFYQEGESRVVLARGAEGLWRFSADTVAGIEELNKVLQTEADDKDVRNGTVPEDVRSSFASPRATMLTFINSVAAGDRAAAAQCLDLGKLPAATRAETGQDLATKLMYAMDRIERVIIQDISDDPAGKKYQWFVSGVGRIELARLEEGEHVGEWRFTAATVRTIEALFEAYEGKPLAAGLEQKRIRFVHDPAMWLRERVPAEFKQRHFVWLDDWQWMALLLIVLIGWAVHRLALPILRVAVRPLVRTQYSEVTPATLAHAVRPLGVLLMVMTWWVGLGLLSISVEAQSVLWPAMKFLATTTTVWALYRLITLVMSYFETRAALTPSRMDDVLVPLLRKTLKVLIVVIGSLFVIRALGYEIRSLLAGLGLGGFAFALAAKDTIANFFGSITVVLDRPFQVGDWVKVGDVEGTVESVGMRSSRIRTFYNSEVTVPNADLITATVDNLGRRRYRRISCKLSVTYASTPEQLDAFCEGIRELIRLHPYTRKDYYLVWVTEFAASSINILLYCFHETPDWVTEMRERHRLFLDIIRLAKRLGVEFAFPTQTIHLSREGDEAGSKTARPNPPSLRSQEEGALAAGRDQAREVAHASLGDSDELPPPFEFPKV